MFETPFDHYLTYGSTDQRTLRELQDSFTGLIVPGTVAAFQREGTGGFVLTFSATQAATPYLIDSRFPLFQKKLTKPKKSHIELASVLGDPSLVSTNSDPGPGGFTPERVDLIARSWVEFNQGYQHAANAKFDKYAQRLNEPVVPEQARSPQFVLAPYTMTFGTNDPWWNVSRMLYDRTCHHLGDPEKCLRVIASTGATGLSSLLRELPDSRALIWVSNLDELESSLTALRTYARAIQEVRDGLQLFALYGGFFSVLLSAFGLMGSCHGIGFGEHRAYPELQRSGPPPSRFYMPTLHRYVPTDLAYQLWRHDPALAECGCRVCNGLPPVALDYHSLMMHSVLCRASEIEEWVGLDKIQIIDRLEVERSTYLDNLARSSAPGIIKERGEVAADPMYNWIQVLSTL
ncbi:MAG: hypothetical protein F4Z29_14230 [Gemmatimonadetes bacterium]|nr:hypothetical protein [Gemmatimonadota bacterium]